MKSRPAGRFVVAATVVLAVAVGVSRSCRGVRRPRPPEKAAAPARAAGFAWPDGARMAVSITFDHAYPSELDLGVPILDAHGLKATFYVDIPRVKERLADWRRVVSAGHEIGNHTLSHPCSGDFEFERRAGRRNALEDVTVEWVERDIVSANDGIRRLLGVAPRTFAYPCGETTVGRGASARSYVPVVDRLFVCGRGFGKDFANNPAACDLAKVNALASDGFTFEMYMRAIRKAMDRGDWVVFCGHAVSGTWGKAATRAPEFERLCAWLADNRGTVWTGTVAEVAEYIRGTRPRPEGGEGLDGI